MKYYVVIDTNVLVSAMLKWDSVPGNLMELAFSEPIIPILSDTIIKEYREVLARPRFHLTDEIMNDVIGTIEEAGIYVNAESLDAELPDPKDKVFYEVVMEERKEENAYLATGNIKHFPTKPFIVTPRQMLDIILSDTEE